MPNEITLSNLQPAPGSTKNRKRIGRGESTGQGGTAGKGHKGQRARSGAPRRAWFEGGQMPLQRRLPKRGFTNINRVEFATVNISRFNELEGDEFTPEMLYKLRVVRKSNQPVKILGNGELTRKVSIKAHAFSSTAKSKIEAQGGEAVLL